MDTSENRKRSMNKATTNFNYPKKLKFESKPSQCSWCGSERIAIVIGGMQVYIPELEKGLDNQYFKAVECERDSNEPSWHCTECGANYFRSCKF